MCSQDYFVTGLATSQGHYDGAAQGITQIVIQCTQYANKANQEEWLYYDIRPHQNTNTNPVWSTFHQSDQSNNPMFVCGANYAGVKSTTASDEIGMVGLQLRYCKDPYYIYKINAVASTTNLTPNYLVDTQVAGQTYSKTYLYNELLFLPNSNTNLTCT